MRKLLVLIFCLNLFGVTQQATAEENKSVDVVLIGGGIMSATLGTYLHELEPNWSIDMYERMNGVAEESSNGWNNAGTGHSAFAEMNYTPEKKTAPSTSAKPWWLTSLLKSRVNSGLIR